MGKASKFNIGRIKIVWIFFRCGNEKMLKIDVFHKTLIPRNLLKEKNIQARSMWNLTSWRFRKCRTYWACELLNESYWPSKMEESEKTGPSSKIQGVKKSENTEIDCLSFFIEFFAWFHIVCDRYTPEYAHFTYFNPIWPLSKYEFRRNRSWPHPDTVSYVLIVKKKIK